MDFWIRLSSSCISRRSFRSRAPERLVEQQGGRAVDERARQGDPLALPAGELARAAVREPVEADDREHLVGPRRDLLARRRA